MPAFVGFQHWVTNMWMYTMHHDTKIVPRFSLHSLGTSTPGAGIAFFWLCLNIFWGVRPKNLSKQSCDHLPTKIAKQNETAWFGDWRLLSREGSIEAKDFVEELQAVSVIWGLKESIYLKSVQICWTICLNDLCTNHSKELEELLCNFILLCGKMITRLISQVFAPHPLKKRKPTIFRNSAISSLNEEFHQFIEDFSFNPLISSRFPSYKPPCLVDFGQHPPRGAALRAARAETDRRGEAHALRRIFRVHWERGDVQVADGATGSGRVFSQLYNSYNSYNPDLWENSSTYNLGIGLIRNIRSD